MISSDRRFRTDLQRSWFLSLSLGFAVLGWGCAGRPPLGRDYAAVGELAQPDGSARLVVPGATVTIRELYGRSRAGFFRSAGVEIDPFDVSRDGQPVFRTFLLEVENSGNAEVMLNSSFCALHAEERRFPLGYTELYSFLMAAVRDDRAVSRLANLMSETATTVRPGAKVEHLLVFNRVGKSRRARLEIDGIRVGDRAVSMRATFLRDGRP